MTIPPELAALQRYDVGHDGTFRKSMSGQVLMYDDVSAAWPQRASGEAKPVAWIDPEYIPELAANYVVNVNLSGGLAHTKFGELDGLVPLYTHLADTSALRECLREALEDLDWSRKYRGFTYPASHWSERARALLAGEG